MTTFKCLECNKKYRTVKAAERAQRNGCSKCGGCDIDIDNGDKNAPANASVKGSK